MHSFEWEGRTDSKHGVATFIVGTYLVSQEFDCFSDAARMDKFMREIAEQSAKAERERLRAAINAAIK